MSHWAWVTACKPSQHHDGCRRLAWWMRAASPVPPPPPIYWDNAASKCMCQEVQGRPQFLGNNVILRNWHAQLWNDCRCNEQNEWSTHTVGRQWYGASGNNIHLFSTHTVMVVTQCTYIRKLHAQPNNHPPTSLFHSFLTALAHYRPSTSTHKPLKIAIKTCWRNSTTVAYL